MKLDELLGKTTNAFTVARTFGAAYEHGDCLIIPVSWVAGGGGGGGGGRDGDPVTADEIASRGPDAGPAGGGVGYGGIAFPLGVYVVKGGEVRWVPAVDVSRLALGGLALLRAVVKRRRSR